MSTYGSPVATGTGHAGLWTEWRWVIRIEQADRLVLWIGTPKDRHLSTANIFLTSAMPYGIVNGMKTEIPIDRAGRVVLPKQVRRHFNLVAGDRLDLEISPEGILLRTHDRPAALVEEHGLLIHEGEAVGDMERIVDFARSDRDAAVLGIRR